MIEAMKKFAGWMVFWATYPYWIIRILYRAMIEYKATHGRSVFDITKEERRAFLNSHEFYEIAVDKSGAQQFIDWLKRWAF